MTESDRTLPEWFPYLDLFCAAVAGGVWYAFPGAGPLPLILVVTPWVIRAAVTGRLSRWTAFDLPLLLFVLTALLAVWSAFDRPAAWTKFWLVVGGVFLFYAFVNAESIKRKRAWLLAFFGAGVALYFLLTHDWDLYPAKFGVLTTVGRAIQAPLPQLPGHRLHPNVAGGLMAMMLPFTGLVVYRSFQRSRGGSWPAAGIALALLALTLLGLIMTTSRSAWISSAVATVLVLTWWVAGVLTWRWPGARPWLFLGVVGAGVAAVLVLGFSWPGGILGLLNNLPGGGEPIGRADLLRNTPLLVRDYPLAGAGLGSFQMLYSTYVLSLHVGYQVHSHNLFLNVAVEQGLLALGALGAMWLLFAAAVWRGVLGPGGRRQSGQLGAAALCLVVVLLHGMVDDVLYGSRAVLLLFLPLAFAAPWTPRLLPEARRRWLGVALPVGIIVLLVLALIWRGPILSAVYSNLGAVHQSRSELGVYSWPEWPYQDEVRRSVDLSKPVAEFERALALDPGNATAHRRLGMIRLARGEYEAALEHLASAYEAEPWSWATRQLYGEALIVNGRLAEGQSLWATLDNSEGWLDLRLWWYEHIGDPQSAERIRQVLQDL